MKLVFFYNLTAATLWACCFCRFVVLLPLVGRRFLPGGIADFFQAVATLPLIGFFVVNLFGRSSYSATDLWSFFNGSRMLWICFGVIFPHPKIAKHTSYSFLIFAWCIQNIVNLTYYAFKVKTKTSPLWLFWLHHHIFFFTFPIAFMSELILLFLSIKFVRIPYHKVALEVCMLSYIPIGYLFFLYLLSRKSKRYDEYMEKRRVGRVSNVELQSLASTSAVEGVNEEMNEETAEMAPT